MLKRALLVLLFLVLFAHPVFLFLEEYLIRNCDDKAVHYYSTAYLAADAAHRQAVIAALPGWMDQLDTQHLKLRFAGRIAYPRNYIGFDLLTRAMRAVMWRGRAAYGVAGWYELPVQTAWLLAFMFAMAWVEFVALGLPRGPWLMAILFAVAVPAIVWLVPVVPMPDSALSPRGAASALALAIPVCFVTRRPFLMAISGLLVVLAHAGFGLVALPVLAAALLLAKRTGTYHTGRWRIYLGAVLIPWTAAALVLWNASSLMPVTRPDVPPAFDAPSMAWAGCSAVALAVLTWQLLRRRVGAILDPANRALFFVGLFFVILCRSVVFIQRGLAVLGVGGETRIHLFYEIPARLSVLEYDLAVLVILLALWMVFRKACARWRLLTSSFLARPLWQGVAVLILAATLVLSRMDTWEAALSRRANFFASDCGYVKLEPVTRDTLAHLDPRIEPEFFYALAEFLFEGK
ncbi:MAG: hypothetical protein BWK77_01060 [Verrucomicrobia bacterium A1]|nr:MAG: hypothetical protein BWK77_01060 [Verrucomicrobia bacterium A1]